MKIFLTLFFFLLFSGTSNSCSAYNFRNSTFNDIKRASAKSFFKIISSINGFEKCGTAELESLKSRWSDVSVSWTLFQTKVENWLRLIPDETSVKDWNAALGEFQRIIGKIHGEIAAGSGETALSEMTGLKIDLLLFFHFNPLDTSRDAAKTGDRGTMIIVFSDVSWFKDELPPELVLFQKKIGELYKNFDEPHRKSFLEWKEDHRIVLKKVLADYFEHHSWLRRSGENP
ncbi:MAG: hypothetical protein PHW04_01405 [Candidatus Wallbacteria bacterium]|nr:hypothetical protein [Candidatus Wallbacteria bacterium]